MRQEASQEWVEEFSQIWMEEATGTRSTTTMIVIVWMAVGSAQNICIIMRNIRDLVKS